MELAIVRGGGVSGIASRTRLHADALSADDARALTARVERAGLLTASEQPAPPPAHADEPRYAVTVGHGEAQRTLRFSESTLPEPVRDLIAWVDAHPAREQEILPPGG
jgi:emfourin